MLDEDAGVALITVNGAATTITLDYGVEMQTDQITSTSKPIGTDGKQDYCGKRIAKLLSVDDASLYAEATGVQDYTFHYVTLTQTGYDEPDYSKRNFTVKFESTSEYDYGLHEFVFTQYYALAT